MTDNIKVMDSTNVVDDVKLKEKHGGRHCESSRAHTYPDMYKVASQNHRMHEEGTKISKINPYNML